MSNTETTAAGVVVPDGDYIGYRPLKPGCIHLYCTGCGRKQSNAPRAEFDPPTAVVAHICCPNCSDGGKSGSVEYLDANGQWVDVEPEACSLTPEACEAEAKPA